MVQLLDGEIVQHQYPVAVDDGVEAVSDSEHHAFSEVVSYGLLNQLICPGVHISRGLIDDEHAVVLQDGSGQTHQLPLPYT